MKMEAPAQAWPLAPQHLTGERICHLGHGVKRRGRNSLVRVPELDVGLHRVFDEP